MKDIKMKIESNKVMNGFETYCVFYGNMAHRCGYVVIPKHLINLIDDNFVNKLDVHGGITHTGVFHDERFGNNVYTIGFDCLHLFDKPDFESAKDNFVFNIDEFKALSMLAGVFHDDSVIRTQEYVEKELEELTKQLSELLK